MEKVVKDIVEAEHHGGHASAAQGAADACSTPNDASGPKAWHPAFGVHALACRTRNTLKRELRTQQRRLGAVTLGVPLAAWLAWQAAVAWWPYPAGFDRPPPVSTLVEDRAGRPLAAFVSEDGQWQMPLTADQISLHLARAVLAVEDNRFYEHGGVDWRSVAGACWDDVRALHIVRGGSTLTMQVARLRAPEPRSFGAKLTQAIRACQIEKRTTKQAILTEYLNRAPFGGNVVGAGAASWRYFGRPCRELSLGQAALLAGVPQSPNRYRPDRHPEAALRRRNHVLARLLACGAITERACAEAQAEGLDARWYPLPQDRPAGQPLADGALPALAALPHTGAVVCVTLDAHLQHQAAELLTQALRSLAPSGVTAGAVVVLDTPSAQPLALASVGPPGNTMDLTRCPRSTGSTLKPFIYAAAFDAGICTPASMLQDSPQAWPGYVPNNYDRQFRGPMTAAAALAESRNIPAMIVLEKVGIERAVGVLEAAGFATLADSARPYGLSLAIGGAEATPLEVAQAYATLGRGGRFVRAALAQASPTQQADRKAPAREVLPQRACWQVLGAISQVERTARVCPEAAALAVAWKTGTSSAHRDAWCAAVTPRRTVVVWLGNLSGPGAAALVGQEAAAPVALKLMVAMDGGGPGWPQVQEQPELSAKVAHTPRLWIVTPTDGQEVILQDEAPAAQQRVFLNCAGGVPHTDRWWFVDERPLATAPEGERVAWSPVAGCHTLRVVDAAGHSAWVRVQVRGIEAAAR